MREWDHTSSILSAIHNLTCVVIGIVSKSKPKPKPPSYFHPFRESSKSGMPIRAENFQDLRLLGNAMCKG